MARISVIEDQSNVGQHPDIDSATGKKVVLAGAAKTVTGFTSGLVYIDNTTNGTLWIRWDGSAAAPVADGSDLACPSFPLRDGASFWFPTTAAGTVSLYGTGTVFLMGAKAA
ncbi:MAG: hypothetical protein K0R61_2370 [Microvirga sp.]|jgi:hypothetical protein|nr:hypothetical protein [Microvirga sp.]MDF2971920.1 hypothetical protein [Microvirga sp.]